MKLAACGVAPAPGRPARAFSRGRENGNYKADANAGGMRGNSQRALPFPQKEAAGRFDGRPACRKNPPAFGVANRAAGADGAQTAAVYAESGYGADELSDRTASRFPKQADETAYVLSFATAEPVGGVRTSAFGARTHPISGEESFHYGLDIAADEGTPIVAFAGGTVRETGFNSYGNYVILDHADGFSTLYAHCSTVSTVQGQAVQAGQTIAAVGATGNATGNHLHFEVNVSGTPVSAWPYLSS